MGVEEWRADREKRVDDAHGPISSGSTPLDLDGRDGGRRTKQPSKTCLKLDKQAGKLSEEFLNVPFHCNLRTLHYKIYSA